MKYCIHCGKEILLEAIYCSHCGKACGQVKSSVVAKINSVDSFKDYAYYFFNLGFNVTCISDQKNEYNSKADNIYLKCPNHRWEHLSEEKQTLVEFNSYSWDAAIGFGIATGFNNLIVIDLDNSTPDFLVQTLELLNLPLDYEWVVLSGSKKGFHIYVFVEDLTETFKTETCIRLFPKVQYEQDVEKTELLIRLHSILPPSSHPSKDTYKFVNCTRPNEMPKRITLATLQNFINELFDSTKQKNMHTYKQKKAGLLKRIGKLLGIEKEKININTNNDFVNKKNINLEELTNLENVITKQGQEIGEYRQFFADVAPLLDKLDKNPELVQAIINGNITPELAKVFTDDSESEEDECQCGDHEAHKRKENPENYDENGNEFEEAPDWYGGSRADYDNYKDSTD